MFPMRSHHLALISLAVALLVTTACSDKGTESAAAAAVPPISAQPPAPAAPSDNTFAVSGPLIVEHQLDVLAQRDGVITSLLSEVGTHVQAGDLLAQLDDRQLSADLEAARAMGLYWGVTALHIPELFETGQVLAWADEWCRANDLIDSGDRVVIVRGVIPNNPNHNALLVHEVE